MSLYQRILVPVDGSATATRGLDEAIALARLTGASLRLVHVLDDVVFVSAFESGASYAKDFVPKLRRRAEKILETARARAAAAGVAVDTILLECFARSTSDVVVEHARSWTADLIVLGTHGRRGIGRVMMGSDAEEIVRSAPVPVLLVRAAGADAQAAALPEGPATSEPVATVA